jgi:hypothetical protein
MLAAREEGGGEPDMIGLDPGTGVVRFADCSAERPAWRWSLCHARGFRGLVVVCLATSGRDRSATVGRAGSWRILSIGPQAASVRGRVRWRGRRRAAWRLRERIARSPEVCGATILGHDVSGPARISRLST